LGDLSAERGDAPLTSIASWNVQPSYLITGTESNEHILDWIFTIKVVLSNFDKPDLDVYVKNLCINYNLTHVNVKDLVGEDAELDDAIGALKGAIKDRLRFRQQVAVVTGFPYRKDGDFPRAMDCLLFLEREIGTAVALASINPQTSDETIEIEEIPVIHFPEPKEPGEDDEEEEEKKEEEPADDEEQEGDESYKQEVVQEIKEV
jgi:hypothetical protein